MRKRSFVIKLVVIIVIIVLALVVLFHYFMGRFLAYKIKTHVPPPTYVSTTIAKSQQWQPRLKAVGALAAVKGVTVTTESSGIVMQIGFKSGQMRNEGQFMVQLDDSLDVQNLKNNEAQLNLAQLDFNRKEKLYRTAAVSKSDYDQSLAQLRKAQAQVSKVLVEISQKRIRAPFTGKAGIRQVNIGQYLNAGSPIVTLQALNPLYVDFSLPQRNFNQIYVGQKISVTIDGFPGKIYWGKITAVNSVITAATRNLDLQATIQNPDHILYPGLFSVISVYLPVQKSVVTVVQTAVAYSLYGDIAYVCEPAGKTKDGKQLYKLSQRIVKVGMMQGNIIQIKSGVKAGEQVVSSGQLKLRDGMMVLINNSIKMTLPKPEDMEGGEKVKNE